MTPKKSNSALFQEDGHLNDMGFAVYVSLLIKQKPKSIEDLALIKAPPEISQHLMECEQCRQRAFELYELAKDD